jgi:tRNA modification GTPase
MPKLNFDDTIAAISTPLGESGIGIVRLSGKEAVKIADKIFLPRDGAKPSQYRSFSIHYGHIIDGYKPRAANRKPLTANRNVIDEALLSVMRAPRTYTKEDIVEINCHGGIVPLRKILDLVIREGARLARPGEFTLRAFLNGRIDLAQAEAVLDIVKAKTDKSLELACQQLEGRFSQMIKGLKEKLIQVQAELEAEIDFPEEDLKFKSRSRIIKEIGKIKDKVEQLLVDSDKGIILKEGISVVIAGKPNVGKSSLMNILLNRERSLVTPVAGTTRDTIEETANIEGIPLKLVDTAGIIQPRNLVEAKAIERSHNSLKAAELVLFMLDGNRKFSREDGKIFDMIRAKPRIILVNKIDLPQKFSLSKVKRFFPKEKIFAISCLTQKGISTLSKEIRNFILGGKVLEPEGCLVTSLRHKEALFKSRLALEETLTGFRNRLSLEFMVLDLKESLDSLGEILGETTGEDVLEKIFAQFCVGK